jgi:uncharacterized protein YndB with AHSA1/START domain
MAAQVARDPSPDATAASMPGELALTRVFDASRPLVWKAWTDPDRVARWWGPHGFTAPVCELDVRAGGAMRIDMRGPDSTVHRMTGTFREVVEPERLVFSSAALDGEGRPLFEMETTVSLAEDGRGRTAVTVELRLLTTTPAAAPYLAGAKAGWTQQLERLEGFLGAEPAPDLGDRELVATRLFDAPRDLVFRMWVDPRHVARWWGPRGFTNTIREMDVRPGGSWRYVMHGPDGTDYENHMVYGEIVPPERLTLLHVSGPHFELTATFTEEAGSTRVTMRQVFESAEVRERVVREFHADEGNRQNLERLGAHLEVVANEARAAATFEVRGDCEIVATRTFDAPRWLVFHASTQPERLARWWGPRGFQNTIHELDVRPGGAWRITQRAPDGSLHPFAGVYLEVVAPERLVQTQRYLAEPFADREMLVTTTLQEHDGRTTMTVTMRLASAAERDALLSSGMEWGMRQGWDRLAEALDDAAVGPAAPWEREIVAVRIVAAPRDLVWRLWTEPEQVARWWGPRGFRTTIRQMDVRAGGAWRFVMHGPDGTDYENEMVYAEVSRPERLVYAHTLDPHFRQEVTFTDLGGGRTRVAVRNTFERAEDVQPYAIEGMGQTLERFQAAAAGRAPV